MEIGKECDSVIQDLWDTAYEDGEPCMDCQFRLFEQATFDNPSARECTAPEASECWWVQNVVSTLAHRFRQTVLGKKE